MSYEFDFADVFAAWPELLQGLGLAPGVAEAVGRGA